MQENGGGIEGVSLSTTSVDDAYTPDADYGAALYWDERYTAHTESFEWYYAYRYFKEIVNEYVARNARLMVAGCGSSLMCEDLADDGYQTIVGTDISRVVIAQQSQLAREYPEITYMQCNMCNSFLETGSFEAIIDKGLFDAIYCALGADKQIMMYVREILRLLSRFGIFILISHHLPETVLLYLENHDLKDADFTPWRCAVSAIPKPIAFEEEQLDLNDYGSVYFIYVCVMDDEMLQKKQYRDEKLAKKKKDRMGKKDWKPAPPL